MSLAVLRKLLCYSNSDVQRSGDARSDCLIACPVPHSGIEQ